MSQETEPNHNSTPSLDKNSFTGGPNKGKGTEKEISSVNRKICNQLRSEKHHPHLPADSDLRQIQSIPPVAGHHHCTEEKKEKGKKTEIMTQAQLPPPQIFQTLQDRNLPLQNVFR